jgi:hypothetical protein
VVPAPDPLTTTCPTEWQADEIERAENEVVLLGAVESKHRKLRVNVGLGEYLLEEPDWRQVCSPPRCKKDEVCMRTCSARKNDWTLGFAHAAQKSRWTQRLALNTFDAFILLGDARGVYLVKYCPIAMGAKVLGFDVSSGRKLYEAYLRGMTSVHSMYSNRVRATLEGGRIVVWGWESMGRYVTALDPADGRMLCRHDFP